MVGYNVQMAVDAKHHLIVAHEVTNIGRDRAQLSSMARAARDAMGKTRLKAIADRGYFSAQQIKACADTGIAAILPKPTTSSAKAGGRFDRADFIYIAREDEYQCPAGERAIYRFTREEHGLQIRRYWSSAWAHSSCGASQISVRLRTQGSSDSGGETGGVADPEARLVARQNRR